MPAEPATKRTIAFFDGQNLFHAVRHAFGYSYPNVDPVRLARQICLSRGWQLNEVRFYTGVPDRADNPFWNHFWTAKLGALGHQNVAVFSRSLRYREREVTLPDGTIQRVRVGEEKGIDVRLAIDVIGHAYRDAYDVALLFSQDQDLSEVADELRELVHYTGRWMKIASAFPLGPGTTNRRGINRTDWIPINRATYDTCIDPKDYRPHL